MVTFSEALQTKVQSLWLQAKDLLLHEKYVGQTRQFDVDIALIVLERRVELSDFIMPACLDWGGRLKPRHNDEGVVSALTIVLVYYFMDLSSFIIHYSD